MSESTTTPTVQPTVGLSPSVHDQSVQVQLVQNQPLQYQSMEKFSTIVQTPELVGYFRDVFTKAGVVVAGEAHDAHTEEFTVVNDGQGFTFLPGLAPDVEFVVPLRQENVNNLLHFASDGSFDAQESWSIVQILFTPLTRAALQSPVVRRNWLRYMAGVESVIHVHLVDPNGGEAARHTLAYAGNQWLVISGLHGNPGRTYWLSPEQALNFQRQLYRAMKEDKLGSWWQFSSWYREWRATVSSPG